MGEQGRANYYNVPSFRRLSLSSVGLVYLVGQLVVQLRLHPIRPFLHPLLSGASRCARFLMSIPPTSHSPTPYSHSQQWHQFFHQPTSPSVALFSSLYSKKKETRPTKRQGKIEFVSDNGRRVCIDFGLKYFTAEWCRFRAFVVVSSRLFFLPQ